MKRLILLLLLALPAAAQTITHSIDISAAWSGTGTACFSVYRATVTAGEAKPALASCVTGFITGCQSPTGQTFCWSDTTAVVGTKYFYTATATVGGVESAPSSEVSGQIVLPPAPTSPAAIGH